MVNAFSGVDEALASYRFVLANLAAFAKIAGSWILILAVVPVLGFQYIAKIQPSDHASAVNGSYLILASLLAISLTFPLFMLSWHRFVLLHKYPKFAIFVPRGAYWSYLWRWWVFNSVAGALDKGILPLVPYLSRTLGLSAPALIRSGLDVGTFLIALVLLGSLHGLKLPSIAAASRDMLKSSPNISWEKLGRTFSLGLVLSALLYPATSLLPDLTHLAPGSYAILEQASLSLLSSLMQFGALAVLSTYLCRSYLAATSAEGTTHPSFDVAVEGT